MFNIIFRVLIVGLIVIVGLMLIRVFKGPSVYDRLNGIFAIGIHVITLLLLIGYITKREDMFVDIAFSYAILGFLSTVIIARFLGIKKGEKNDD